MRAASFGGSGMFGVGSLVIVPPDILINNLGVGDSTPFEDISDEPLVDRPSPPGRRHAGAAYATR